MRTLATVLVAGVAFGMAAPPADACGDKLLVIGRRVKRIPQAKHPAHVLLYLRPGSALPAAAKEMSLESTLRQAGHRVDTVERTDRLRGQLAAGSYDFVLTDLSDAETVSGEAISAPGMPEIVPVTSSDEDEAVLRSSGADYPLVIEVGRGRSYLSALDSAMKIRDRAAGR